MQQLVDIQAELWGVVRFLEPWIWWAKAAAAGLCFVCMLFQPWKISLTMKVLRYFSMIGMLVIAFSWGNTAFGPLGDIIFWLSFAAYQACLIHRLLPALRAQMASAPPAPEIMIWNYVRGKRNYYLSTDEVKANKS